MVARRRSSKVVKQQIRAASGDSCVVPRATKILDPLSVRAGEDIVVRVNEAACHLCGAKRPEAWLEVQAPARLRVIDRSLAVDAVITQDVRSKLCDGNSLDIGSDEFARGHLCEALIQSARSLAFVGSPGGLAKGLAIAIKLDPPNAAVFLAIDPPGSAGAPHSSLLDPLRARGNTETTENFARTGKSSARECLLVST